MQKDSAQAKISLKVVGGLLFLTHPVQTLIPVLNWTELCNLRLYLCHDCLLLHVAVYFSAWNFVMGGGLL